MDAAIHVSTSRPASTLSGGGSRRARERAIEAVLASAALVTVIVLVGIFGVLVVNAFGAFTGGGDVSVASLTAAERAMLSPRELADLEKLAAAQPTVGRFLGSTSWNPTAAAAPQWGVLGMVVSTLMVTILAMGVAVPVGIGVAAWLAYVAPAGAREVLKPVLELLAAVPSVVVGFLGLVVVGPFLARVFGLPNGLNALNGGVLLALMALPTIVSLSEDAIRAVPQDYVQASLALGADRWQTLVRVVVPAARSGLVAAAMLGMGRAIGETMTVLMATGNAVAFPHGPFDSVRTLTATVAIELGEVTVGSTHYQTLFAVGLVLFGITFLVNLVAEIFLQRGRQA